MGPPWVNSNTCSVVLSATHRLPLGSTAIPASCLNGPSAITAAPVLTEMKLPEPSNFDTLAPYSRPFDS